MKKTLYTLVILLIVIANSCKKDENTINDETSNGGNYKISVMGIIEDENGDPILGATVSLGDKQYNSDDKGVFIINNVNVPTKRAVITVTKFGFWDRQYAFIPSNNTQHYCKVKMPLKQFNYSVSATAGGTIAVGSASLAFQSNSFVNTNGTPYNGTVQIAARHLPVSDPNLKALIPGRDLLAEDLAGDEKILITFGMIGVELQASNGDKLQLASGKNATITMPIDASQQASAPATIPLWYFDTTKNLWKEEGAATKQGNNYVGQVAHFSWWNYDVSATLITVTGTVINCDGTPAPYSDVNANGLNGSVFTNSNGVYSDFAPSGFAIEFKARNYYGFSPIVYFAGSTINATIPDINLPCADYGNIKIEFQDCNGSPISGSLWLQNDSSGNIRIASVIGNYSVNVSQAELGQTNYKAYSNDGKIVTGTINVLPHPLMTTLPTVHFCDPNWNTNLEYYSIDILPSSGGCAPPIHIEDTLSYDSLSAGTNNVTLYLLDADSNIVDTSLVINGIIDMQQGFQQFDTNSVKYINFQVRYNNTTIYVSTDIGVLNIISTGTSSGSFVELVYSGNASVTIPGSGNCFADILFRARFKRN